MLTSLLPSKEKADNTGIEVHEVDEVMLIISFKP
jgi:hypothetical protein